MMGIESFLWGFSASLGFKLVQLSEVLEAGRPVPKRYRSPGYWLVILGVALLGGLFAAAAQVQTPIVAMHIGVSTPLIANAFRERFSKVLGGGAEQ